MSRSAPGPVASLVIVTAATLFFLVDRARGRRAQRRNESGQCGRCGAVLLEPGARVQVAGGPYAPMMAFVCPRCRAAVKLQERILWSLLGAALLAVLALMGWRSLHP